jgi:subtilisin family serine protease
MGRADRLPQRRFTTILPPGRRHAGSPRHSRPALRLLRLEDRTLPSAALADLREPAGLRDRGDVYYYDGKPIALSERVGDYVVHLSATRNDTPVRALADDWPLAGFTVGRQLDADTFIVHGPAEAVGPFPTAVAWITPLYQSAASDTWLGVGDEVIVALRPGVNAAEFFAGDGRFGDYRPLSGTDDQFVATAAAGPGPATLALAADLRDDPRLAWAAPNFWQDHRPFYSPNDPIYSQQWHLNNTGQNGSTLDADVDAPEAWDVTPGGSPDVVIAVVDSGMDLAHPDLAANLFVNAGEVPGNGLDDDGNGWVDDGTGWDFFHGDGDPGATSTNDNHATSVAGIAAARGDNGLGVAGVAYQSRILPVRIFNGGTATTDANIASAVYYAAGRTADGRGTWRAADVLNNSWGGGSPSTALTGAVTWAATQARGGKGAVALFAAGNGGGGSVSYPASLSGTVPGVFAVGASTDRDLRASYSQYGTQLDVLAPSRGGNFGTVTTDVQGSRGYNGAAGAAGDYTTTAGSAFGGTSSATPLAAGIAALVLARDPALTAAQVRGVLRNTTDFIGGVAYDAATGFNSQYGYGKLNAAAAVAGVGTAEIQVLVDGSTNVPTATGVLDFSAGMGASQTVTVRVRNQGTADLTLGPAAVTPGPFTLASSFGDAVLSAGEATTFTIRFTPAAGGNAEATLSFATNDADEGTFTISLRGRTIPPRVSGTTPSGPVAPPVSAVDVIFSQPMDPASFDVAADVVSFTGPAGDLRTAVSGAAWLSPTTLRITFAAQAAAGSYQLVLGPDVRDASGLALDQNGNGTPGEVPGDRYAVAFTVGATAGVDTFGYRYATTAYDPALNLNPGDPDVFALFFFDTDDDTDSIYLAANPFTFYGNSYDLVFVSTNGLITLGTRSSAFTNTSLATSPSAAAIAPFWDDLVTGSNTATDDQVLYQVQDRDADGVLDWLVINWRNVHFYAGEPGRDDGITFQAALRLNSGPAPGAIVFNYTDLSDGTPLGNNNGGSATVGIKDAGPQTTVGRRALISQNNAANPLVGDGKAIRVAVNSGGPTAVANGPYSVAAGGTVKLSAAGSSDPDDPTADLTYLWDLDGDGVFGEAGVAAARGDEVGPAPTFNATGLAGGAEAAVALRVFDTGGLFDTAQASVRVTAPPRVGAVAVDDGTGQRSMVRSLTVTFTTTVTLPPDPAAAFRVTGPAGPVAVLVDLSGSTATQTVARLTFSGPDVVGGSLADGNYTLTVVAAQVRDESGQPLDGDAVVGFRRLYGDVTGDGTVNGADFNVFRLAFGSVAGIPEYVAALDFNADGAINGPDFGAFRERFGVTLPPP